MSTNTKEEAIRRLSGLATIASIQPKGITQFEIDQAVWAVLGDNQDLVIETKVEGYSEEAFIKHLPSLLSERKLKHQGLVITPTENGLEVLRGVVSTTAPYADVLHKYIEPLDPMTLKCEECGESVLHMEGGKLVAHTHEEEQTEESSQAVTQQQDRGPIYIEPGANLNVVPPIAEVKMDNWTPIRVLLTLAKTVTDEVLLQFTPEGLTWASMDKSHIELGRVNIPAAAFTGYVCEKAFDRTLRVDDYKKKLPTLEKKEPLAISIKDEAMFIANGSDRFALRFVDGWNAKPPTPTVAFDTKFSTNSTDFLKLLKKAADFEQVHVEAQENGIHFWAKADDGEFDTAWTKRPGELLSLENAVAQAKAAYNVEYLNGAVKALPPNTVITIEYATTKPIRITAQLDNKGSTMVYYLAPRVSS